MRRPLGHVVAVTDEARGAVVTIRLRRGLRPRERERVVGVLEVVVESDRVDGLAVTRVVPDKVRARRARALRRELAQLYGRRSRR